MVSALLRKVTSKNNSGLNGFHSFTTEAKIKLRERFCKYLKFCLTSLPMIKTKILSYIKGSRFTRNYHL